VTPKVDQATVDKPPRKSRDRQEAMLATFESYDDLQTMCFFGDFDDLIAFHHLQFVNENTSLGRGTGPYRGGALFARRTSRQGGLVAHNYDNRESQLMVGWFYPTGGYRSVALVPLADLGYTPEEPFDSANEKHRKSLIYAPVLSIEGMNERGVTVVLGSLPAQDVTSVTEQESRYVMHLVREILDQAGSVNEAVAIAEKYNVFDFGLQTVSHQIFLADGHSGSAVLEWCEGQMHMVKDAGDWQVAAADGMYKVSPEARRSASKSYRKLYDEVAKQEDPVSWQSTFDVLADVKRKNKKIKHNGEEMRVGTQWSTVFDSEKKEIRLSVDGDHKKIYLFSFEAQENGSGL
ncbi:MAG: hypothetical protein ACI9UK_001486, partial [Candidatus Krumholzibacteriia bacterium]